MKYLFLILVITLSLNAKAGDYVGKSGQLGEIRFTTYWGGHSCVELDGTWFHFKHDESGIDYLKSMILAAKASKAAVTIGSNTSNEDTVCGNLTSLAVISFTYRD